MKLLVYKKIKEVKKMLKLKFKKGTRSYIIEASSIKIDEFDYVCKYLKAFYGFEFVEFLHN